MWLLGKFPEARRPPEKKAPFFHILRAFLDAYDALCHKIAPSHKKVVTYAECASRDCHLKDNYQLTAY